MSAVQKQLRPRLQQIDRQQLVLRPIDAEQLIPEDHEARAIWEFVGQLDLSRYYEAIRSVEGVAGRESIDPRLLISLWIYSYTEGIGSAREISRLCEYHPAYQWLTGLQPINYHTLSDFRVKHKEALDELFTNALGLLSAEGLISLQRVMHDGMKVKACAGSDSFRSGDKVQAHLEQARSHVAEMGDPQTAEEVSPRIAAARRRVAREREQKLASALSELEKIRELKDGATAKAEARVSESDPECRIMKEGNGGYAPAYNVQVSTDAASGVIVGVGVTQAASDYHELIPAVERIEENLAKKPEQMVADGGFTSRANILEMDIKGVEYIGAMRDGAAETGKQGNRWGIDPAFRSEVFCYNADANTYTCPCGKELRPAGKGHHPGRINYQYRADGADCQACTMKEKCCPKSFSKGRMVVRGEDHPVVTSFVEKMQTDEAKKIYRQRGGIAEFTNAWLKAKNGLRQFSVRGLPKVGMETLWVCLTYNIQQWIRLRWRMRGVAMQGATS